MMTVWLYLLAIWFGVIWSFAAVMHAKSRMQSGGLTRFWKVHMAPLALIGLALDVAFNWTFGHMFVEQPPWHRYRIWRFTIPLPELLFSSRVQRHYRGSDGWRYALAAFWARQLNQMDPGHIRS